MFTVEEVSKLLSVSKVTIYAKLKKYGSKVVVKQGKKYVTEELLSLIKQELNLKECLKYNLKVENNTGAINQEIATDRDDLINLNQDLINFLKQQLEEKDIQLREKDKQIEELINLNKNNQILLKQQQDKEINQKLLEDHFQEVDQKLMDLRDRMEEKKNSKKFFGFFSK
ncbi:hypothetical protein [Clostridium paraputrificum]|mgnify:FL=1|uniref:hypothetical protein n=1 Tax=Clostridium paraputrificum TaxID=29363 RepID=UPI000C07BB12|nr:hypothetical protein [Clostridium paraputrificum]MDB2105074.1 hypothetical protein [Clostridium paraputrificum]MDY3361961.1 hypothetical protein [Clostridium celatum]